MIAAIREHWARFWFTPESPTALGVSRVVFFALIWILNAGYDFAGYGGLDTIFWEPVFLLSGLRVPVASTEVLAALQLIWKTALVLSSVGLVTRLSTSVAFLLGLYLLGLRQSFGHMAHSDHAVVLVLLIMALSRCGAAWSIDGLIRTACGGDAGSAVERRSDYRWPTRMVWLVLALVFVSAGLTKLRAAGFGWALSDHLKFTLILRSYDIDWLPPTEWGLYIARHDWLSRGLATATLAVELGYPLALVSRRARWIIVPAMFGMLIGFRLLMSPTFYSLMVCHAFWIPWDRVGRVFARWLDGRRTHAVLFDGGCGLCSATIATLRRLDLLRRLEMCDVRNDWRTVSRRFPALGQSACLEDMHVVGPRGDTWKGFQAYRALAWVIPAAWPLLPILYLPPVEAVGHRVYRRVADRRNARQCALPEALTRQDTTAGGTPGGDVAGPVLPGAAPPLEPGRGHSHRTMSGVRNS